MPWLTRCSRSSETTCTAPPGRSCGWRRCAADAEDRRPISPDDPAHLGPPQLRLSRAADLLLNDCLPPNRRVPSPPNPILHRSPSGRSPRNRFRRDHRSFSNRTHPSTSKISPPLPTIPAQIDTFLRFMNYPSIRTQPVSRAHFTWDARHKSEKLSTQEFLLS